MQLATVFGLLAALATGVWLWDCHRRRECAESKKSRDIVRENAELIEKRLLLEKIREGKAVEMADALEFAVDTHVESLSAELSKMHPFTREQVLQTLRLVKRYRKAWPRCVSCESSYSEDLRSTMEQAARGAERILTNLDGEE